MNFRACLNSIIGVKKFIRLAPDLGLFLCAPFGPPELIVLIGTNIYHHKAVLSSLEKGDPASSMNTGVPVSISSDVLTGNTDFEFTVFSTDGMLVPPPTLLPLTKLELDIRQIQMHRYNQSRLR